MGPKRKCQKGRPEVAEVIAFGPFFHFSVALCLHVFGLSSALSDKLNAFSHWWFLCVVTSQLSLKDASKLSTLILPTSSGHCSLPVQTLITPWEMELGSLRLGMREHCCCGGFTIEAPSSLPDCGACKERNTNSSLEKSWPSPCQGCYSSLQSCEM